MMILICKGDYQSICELEEASNFSPININWTNPINMNWINPININGLMINDDIAQSEWLSGKIRDVGNYVEAGMRFQASPTFAT